MGCAQLDFQPFFSSISYYNPNGGPMTVNQQVWVTATAVNPSLPGGPSAAGSILFSWQCRGSSVITPMPPAAPYTNPAPIPSPLPPLNVGSAGMIWYPEQNLIGTGNPAKGTVWATAYTAGSFGCPPFNPPTQNDAYSIYGSADIQNTTLPGALFLLERESVVLFFGFPIDIEGDRAVLEVRSLELPGLICAEASVCAVRVPVDGFASGMCSELHGDWIEDHARQGWSAERRIELESATQGLVAVRLPAEHRGARCLLEVTLTRHEHGAKILLNRFVVGLQADRNHPIWL